MKRARIDGDEPGCFAREELHEDLRCVAAHRLADQDRTRDAFGGEDFVQPVGKIIHRPRERERARFPVRRWVPNEQASLADEVLDLLL